MKAQWIWKQNEFEFDLYNKMTYRRRERAEYALPRWSMPHVNYCETFLCCPHFDEETTVTIRGEGTVNLRVGETPSFVYDFNGSITLPAGDHILFVEVYNPNGLPCIFVEGKGCESGEGWEVYDRDGCWKKVAYAGLYDPETPPSKYGLPTREKQPVKAERVKSEEGVDGVLYTFDKEVLAYAAFRGVKTAGKVEVFYGESREEALDTAHSELCDCFQIYADENFVAPLTKAFRFVFVQGEGVYDEFLCMEEYYPAPNRAKFKSNDELLNKIYDVSLYTLALTSREFFIDGIKRDRWVWAGDTLQSEWMTLYSYFDVDIVKRTLIALLGKEKFYHHVNGIMDYSFYVIMAAREYYRYTGDKAFIERIFPQLKELLNFCLSRRNKNGLMQRVNGEWVFIDWAEFPVDGEVCAEQILLCESLRYMAEIAKLVGQDNAEWNALAAELPEKINEKYWTEQGYAHDETKSFMTRYGGIFATLFGCANNEQRKVILEKTLLSDEVQAIKTPYMKFYEMSAIAELGGCAQMLDYVKSYWGGMLSEGATTFWEEYDPNVKGAERYAMYGRRYGKSLCHSWGAAPVYLLGRYLVGLKPASIGYKTFELTPWLDGKTFFEAELPANEGFVRVKYDGEALTVYSDKADGTVHCFGKSYAVKAGYELRVKAEQKRYNLKWRKKDANERKEKTC